MKKIKFSLFFCLCFILYSFKTYSNYKREEVSIKETSSNFYKQKDSVFRLKYKNLLNTYEKENYVEVLNKSLALYDNVKNKDSLKLVTLLIADIYDKTNHYKKALKFYKKTLNLIVSNNAIETETDNDKLTKKKLYAKTLLRIGSEYQKLSKLDSAKYYYKELEEIESFNSDILKFKAVSFGNLSGIYEKDSLFDKAKMYANKAIIIHKDRKDKVNEANAINNLANIYLSLGDYKISKKLYLEGVDLIKNDNSANAVRSKASLYYNLAWAMRNLKDYKAYDFQELSYELEDGIKDKEIKTIVETISAKYNVKSIKEEEERKRLKDQRTFWIYGITCFVVILSLLYWVNFFKLKQKNLGLQLFQSKLVQNQHLEKIKSESQVRILNATIDGKETERKQIAETLHDSVSALLSSANLHLQAAKSQFNGKTPIEIDKSREIIAEASQKIRDLSHTLVSSVLLKFGLKYAINDMAEKYSNSKIKINTDIGELRRYHQNFEIKVHNITQEFVNNILKHSGAENATIKLEEVKDKLSLTITDDGVGFDKKKVSSKSGLGLNQIEARIKMMQGIFLIDTFISKGTEIYVELPVIEREQVSHV